MIDPVLHIIEYAQGHFVNLLIVSFRRTRNSQSLDSCNKTQPTVHFHKITAINYENTDISYAFSLVHKSITNQLP